MNRIYREKVRHFFREEIKAAHIVNIFVSRCDRLIIPYTEVPSARLKPE